MKKLVALLLAVMMLSAMALAEAPEGYPAVVEGIDFGGATVTIYDYWSGEGKRAEEPTEEQQAQYDYRDWLMETYNVVIEQKQGGDWNTCAEEMINFVSAPDGSYRAYIIEPGKVGSLVANGVAAPVKYDFSAEKWNTATLKSCPASTLAALLLPSMTTGLAMALALLSPPKSSRLSTTTATG